MVINGTKSNQDTDHLVQNMQLVIKVNIKLLISTTNNASSWVKFSFIIISIYLHKGI